MRSHPLSIATLLLAASVAAASSPAASAQAAADASSISPELRSHPAQMAAAEPAYRSDPKFQKALEQAKVPRQTPEDRLENWKHANKVAKGQCIECLREMITWQLRTSAWKDAVASALQLEALNPDLKDRILTEADRGAALMRYNSGSPKPAELAQADAAFRDVLAKVPKMHDVVFMEGKALAMMGKNDEAKAMFERFVDLVPASNRLRSRAERFAEDPHLATLPLAPPFRLITSDGEEMQLDDMNGKVVLLDFWATWCGPCKESLPEIARIAKDYANDPMLVVISVSQDADASAWKAFVEKNHMTWPQYRDRNNALSNAYAVASIPHFFTIDTNGVLKTEQVGSNANVRIIVNELVKKAHKAEAQKAKSSDKAAGQ